MPNQDAPATPRTPLSRHRILRAAVTLADEGGLDALSMRKLAEALGVEAMSLYNHIKNKDDLLDGMVDLVVAEITLPPTGPDWKSAMRLRATSAHEVMLRHPWAPLLMMSRVNVGPAMLRYVDATIGVLREAGFSYRIVDHAWNAIDNHIYGFTLQAINFPFQPEEYAEAAAAFLHLIPASTHPYMNELTKLVSKGEHDGASDFNFGLELLLDGIDRLPRIDG